jgi:hypothetical protein
MIDKEKVEQEQNLKETQEKSAMVANPSKVIDLTKDEEHVDKVGVPIINESENKEEPPEYLVGEKKVETCNDNNEQDTQLDEEDTSETKMSQYQGPNGGKDLEVPFPGAKKEIKVSKIPTG